MDDGFMNNIWFPPLTNFVKHNLDGSFWEEANAMVVRGLFVVAMVSGSLASLTSQWLGIPFLLKLMPFVMG